MDVSESIAEGMREALSYIPAAAVAPPSYEADIIKALTAGVHVSMPAWLPDGWQSIQLQPPAQALLEPPSHACLFQGSGVDVSESIAEGMREALPYLLTATLGTYAKCSPGLRMRRASPYLLAATELFTLDYFQKAKDRPAYALTNLSQCEELPPEVLRPGALEPPEDPAMSRLEARMARLETSMIKLEKEVATMAATVSKRKAKRGRPSSRKTRIGRHASYDRSLVHSSGTPCCQFMQNSGAVFPAHDLSVRNSHGWSGVAHAACSNTSTSPCVPASTGTKSKLAINTAGRTLINAARKALAWMSKRAAAASFHEVVRFIIGSHGQGGG